MSGGGSTEWGDRPVDELIRELARSRRAATGDEIDRIRNRLSTAPFSTQVVRTAIMFRGINYLGRTVEARDDAAFLHLVQRVIVDRQWNDGTTMEQYISDLHQLSRDPDTQLLVYDRGSGAVAAAFGPNRINAERLGSRALPYLFVVYSADRSSIITGYQTSSYSALNVSDEPLWLS